MQRLRFYAVAALCLAVAVSAGESTYDAATEVLFPIPTSFTHGDVALALPASSQDFKYVASR